MRFILAVLFWCVTGLSAQTGMVLQRGNSQQPLHYLGEGMYSVAFEDTTFLIIPKATVDSLLKKIAVLQAQNRRLERVVAAKDSLLNAYETFEINVRRYVTQQQQLLQMADSLFMGYKSLYKDAKALVGYGRYALWGQVTIARLGEPVAWKPLGSVGIGFRNWMIGYQFGQSFQGISVGIRWPVGW